MRNGIALGRFGSETSAQRRQAQLQAAGFTAQVGPVGDVATEGWIDVAAGPAFDAARAAQDIAAPRTQTLDCATLRRCGHDQAVRRLQSLLIGLLALRPGAPLSRKASRMS